MESSEDILTFAENIENRVEMYDISYMDAVVMYCEETGLEIELAAKLIHGKIKDSIKTEAENLHYLPKSNTARLPI